MLLRDLLADQDSVHKLFAGQNLDAEVRLSAEPGLVEVIVEDPEAPANPKKEGK